MATESQGPRISVIIPARNAESTLPACLRAIAASSLLPFETILVSDASSDGTDDVAAAAGVRVVRNERRQGAAYARNVGARAAHGDIFFFVDADCVVQRDTFALGLEAFLQGADVIFGSYTSETTAGGFLAQFKNYQHHHTHQRGQTIQTSFWSGCGAITRPAFEAIEGFDVSLHACEDIEFGWALTQAGYQVELVKAMQVEHLKTYSLLGLIRSDLRARAIPWTRLIRAGRGEMGKLNTGRDGVLATTWTGVFWLTLLASPFWPATAPAALMALAGMAWHSRALLGFIRSRRGILFTVGSIAALALHYSICGVGFVAGHLAKPYPRQRAAVPEYRYAERTQRAIDASPVVLERS
ncbi:MAG: glycosyltransferase family 2 protein [Bryobacterales bacterium]